MRAEQLPLTVFRIVVWLSWTFLKREELKWRLMLPDLVDNFKVGEKLRRGLRMSASESSTVMLMLPEAVLKSMRSYSV